MRLDSGHPVVRSVQGCGEGRVVARLQLPVAMQQVAPCADAVGIDISPDLIPAEVSTEQIEVGLAQRPALVQQLLQYHVTDTRPVGQ